MSLSEFFGWGSSSDSTDLPEIFPISISQSDFVDIDVVSIYSKILTDVVERTSGLTDDQIALLWDNCVKSSKQDGLVTLLSKAMSNKKDLFLVYDKPLKVLRTATSAEQAKITEDYAKQATSKVGVFISFQNYVRSDMVKLYSGLDFCTVASLHKSMNVAKAVQLKFNDMRSSVSLTDSTEVKAQAVKIANSLKNGKDVMLDAKDSIETAKPDLTAVNEAIELINQKRSFYLGLPAAYITGEQTGGLSSTGESDTKAIERGLKNYYFSIIKPVLEALFDGAVLSYKSQDIRNILGSMEVIKTFTLSDDELISKENKTMIVNQLLGLPEDAKGDPVKKTEPVKVTTGSPVPNQPPVTTAKQ